MAPAAVSTPRSGDCAIGALAREDGSYAEGAGGAELQLGLVEAALACGAEVDPRSTRFLILDRHRWSLSDAELKELGGLGFRGSAEQNRRAVERRRREVEALSGGPRVGAGGR